MAQQPRDGSVLDIEALSPELVLVDPELRAAVLARPEPVARWAIAATVSVVPLEPAPARRRRGRLRGLVPVAVASLAAAALMLGVLRLPSIVHRHFSNSRAQPSGRDLVWVSIAGVRGYHVLVASSDRVVVDTVTAKPHIRLNLVPGEYRWWVLPVEPDGSQAPAIVAASLVVGRTPEA